VLLPNGTLDRFFDDVDPGDSRDRLGAAEGQTLVTYAGTLGIAQALPHVLDAAALSGGDIRWALVGEGPLKEELTRRVADDGLSNVVVHPGVPIEHVPPLLSASDVLLVTLSGHPTFADFVPSKLIDCMAAGRPVLLSAAGEAVRILDRAGAGVAVTPERPDELVAGARWLAEHPKEAAAMGERGRAFARTRLRRTQAERLEQLLIEVAGR
jgi:glycosyltransferase involved in cell wall biosynthesis